MTRHDVPPEGRGQRLDRWLREARPDLSRARIQQLVQSGHIRVNGNTVKPRHAVSPGDVVDVEPPEPVASTVQPEAIPLNVLYEDADLIAINKPPNLVVHPAPGHESGTLVNALLHHCGDLTGVGGERRPGIVHRLDKDTSGVMVVAKTERGMAGLARQFKDRTARKHYLAIVRGAVTPETGTIETLIGRHPQNRKRMSARADRGREARTRYATVERFTHATLLDIVIETGRTHQIRVHMAHVGHPVVGDREYGRARTLAGDLHIDRQMLHAARLILCHPVTGLDLEFTAPLPDDVRTLIQTLRNRSDAPPC